MVVVYDDGNGVVWCLSVDVDAADTLRQDFGPKKLEPWSPSQHQPLRLRFGVPQH